MKNLTSMMLMIAFIAVIASCKKDKVVEETPAPETKMTREEALKYRSCTVLLPDGASPRGVTLKSRQWDNGSKIKVSLSGATQDIRDKVIKYASEWEKYANIDFQFVTDDNIATIRVTFDAVGHWSFIGSDAKQIPTDKSTMNLQFDNNTDEKEIRRVTLHEFGHALGMLHEHQHPKMNIPYTHKFLVYMYYGFTMGWSRELVDRNIFDKVSEEQTNFSAYDTTSIMHYDVPFFLTDWGSFSVGMNDVLSATDKEFIAKVYPK